LGIDSNTQPIENNIVASIETTKGNPETKLDEQLLLQKQDDGG
jgi:hypothetical protein